MVVGLLSVDNLTFPDTPSHKLMEIRMLKWKCLNSLGREAIIHNIFDSLVTWR